MLPDSPPDEGVLYVVPPITEARQSLGRYLDGAGMPYELVTHGVFAIPYGPGGVERLCSDYFCTLGALEARDTRTLTLKRGSIVSVCDILRAQPLSALLARMHGRWLSGIIADERIVTYFHPIVRAEAPLEVYAYECLARGMENDGSIIAPDRMFSVARDADILFNLDRACRLAAIRDARRCRGDAMVFINFNPTAIYKPEFCLRTTLEAMEEAGFTPANVVFEVVESDHVGDVGHLLSVLDYYRERGFRVALDDLGAGYGSLNLLSQLRPDYIKLDIQLVRNVDSDSYKARITENLLELATRLDIPSIAEGVETVAEWQWLKAHGARLVQGYLFARPAAEPPRPVLPGRG